MFTAIYGLGWFHFQRHRVGIYAFLCYTFALWLALRLMHLEVSPSAAFMISIPFLFGVIYILGAFVSQDTDMASTRSGYSQSLFTLPLRTFTLVFWPMLFGSLSMVICWILYDYIVLLTQQNGSMLYWPAALIAAIITSLQALMWYPIPLPFLRGIAAVLLLAALTSFGVLGSLSGMPEGILCAVYVIIIAASAVLGYFGVSVARHGSGREIDWNFNPSKSPDTLPEFKSGSSAQLWCEIKRGGALLPLMTLLILLLFQILVVLGRNTMLVPLGIGDIQITITARMWLASFILFPISAITVGCCTRRADTFQANLMLLPFLATKPLTCVDFVQIKVRLAAFSAIVSIGIQFVFLLGWLCLPGSDGTHSGAIGLLLVKYISLKSIVYTLISLLLYFIIVWKCHTLTLWIELSGRKWLMNAAHFLYPMLMMTLIGWVSMRFSNIPDLIPHSLKYLSYVLYTFCLIKSCAAGYLLWKLHRNLQVTGQTIRRFVGMVILFTLSLAIIIVKTLPENSVQFSIVFFCILYLLPVVRLLAAPLTLQWNRHR